MDIATYGVGSSRPRCSRRSWSRARTQPSSRTRSPPTKGTAVLDIFLVIGFVIAIALVDRVGRIPLQITGFAVMALSLGILGLAEGLPGGGNAHLGMVFVGFAFFNTFMNAGPNATTYALPAEVFPGDVRAAGHGFAAGCAKLGAALGVFLFPSSRATSAPARSVHHRRRLPARAPRDGGVCDPAQGPVAGGGVRRGAGASGDPPGPGVAATSRANSGASCLTNTPAYFISCAIQGRPTAGRRDPREEPCATHWPKRRWRRSPRWLPRRHRWPPSTTRRRTSPSRPITTHTARRRCSCPTAAVVFGQDYKQGEHNQVYMQNWRREWSSAA